MARNTSQEVFDLIKKLSSKERRAFVQSLNSRQKDLIMLFLAIENQIKSQQDSYNEQAIAKKMPGKPLSVLKHKLYDAIKEFLLSQCWGKSPSRQLVKETEFIWQLIDKNLFPQAKKEIQKIIKQASAIESFVPWADALEIQGHFVEQFYSEKEVDKKIIESFESVVRVKEMNLNLARLNLLNVKVLSLEFKSKGKKLSKNEIAELGSIIKILEMDKEIKADSFKAKTVRLATLRSAYAVAGEKEKALNISYELVQLIEQHPIKIHHSTAVFSNLLNFLHQCGNPADSRYTEVLNKYDPTQLPESLRYLYDWKFYFFRFIHAVHYQKWNEAALYTHNVVEILKKHKALENIQSTYSQNMITIGIWHVLNEDYDSAADYFNRVAEKGKPEVYSEFYLQALTWRVLCYVNMGHKNILLLISSLKYFVEKHFSHYYHYQLLVTSLEKNINKHAEIKIFWQTVWQNLVNGHRKELNKIIADNPLDCFSFIYALSHDISFKDVKQNKPKLV